MVEDEGGSLFSYPVLEEAVRSRKVTIAKVMLVFTRLLALSISRK